MDYWEECISEALREEGIAATPEQINNIAGAVEASHDNYSLGHGHDCIPHPLESENERIKRDASAETDRVDIAHRKEIEEWEWRLRQKNRRIDDLLDEVRRLRRGE